MLTLPKRLTYDDYRQIPDDGQGYEILDGEVYVSPSPTIEHQHASRALFVQLMAHFVNTPWTIYYAPIDVLLSDSDIVQPDLVVAGTRQLTRRGIEGSPLIVVEVVAPGRPTFDRTIKARRYATHQVKHYWIADPQTRSIEIYALTGTDDYELSAEAKGTGSLEIPAFAGLTLHLAELWIDLPRE